LLRARGKWPRDSRADKSDERAPLQPIGLHPVSTSRKPVA
jgi:hypothetical protein